MKSYKKSNYLKFCSEQKLLKINNYINNKIQVNEEEKIQIKHLLNYLIEEKDLKLKIDYIYRNLFQLILFL